jgi:hypothetical protein
MVESIELVEANIMLFRGLMPWGADLVRTAEEIGRWRKSSTWGGEADPRRTSVGQLVSANHDPRLEPFETMMKPVVVSIINAWDSENSFTVRGETGYVRNDELYTLLKYGVGCKYDLHADAAPYRRPGSFDRQISVVAFPIAEVEGGELYFPRQRIIIKPEAGLIVTFPSATCYPHESLAVWKGAKYSLVTWLF